MEADTSPEHARAPSPNPRESLSPLPRVPSLQSLLVSPEPVAPSPVHSRATLAALPTKNSAEPYPLRVRVVILQGPEQVLLREDRNNNIHKTGVSLETRLLSKEVKRRNVFVVDMLEEENRFLLRNIKSNQCLGCVSRSGYLVTALFAYSVDRARELVWQRRGQYLFNTFHDAFLGKALPSDTRETVQGLLQMVSDEAEAISVQFVPVPCHWSFNTSAKASLTASADGNLVLQAKGFLSWSPYFEIVPCDDDPKCFQLRAKGNDANPLFVKVAANNRLVLKPTNPDSFYLVKTLKSNFFNLCCGSMYVALSSDNFIKLTKSHGDALSFSLMDAKLIEHRSIVGKELKTAPTAGWDHVVRVLTKMARHPISKPIFASCPKVLEREMSTLASIFFIAQQHEPEKVRLLLAETDDLTSMDRVLLSNAAKAAAMTVAISFKHTKLFQCLDQEITTARLGVSSAEKLFVEHVASMPHVTQLQFQRPDSVIRVALVSDFGRGGPKQRDLLDSLFATNRPDVFIHLGDVYKRGSKREQQENLLDPVSETLKRNPGLPVQMFAICGNHDLMTHGGSGYYYALKEMRARSLSEQDASIFCLLVGASYAIIGLDTSVEGLKYDSDALYTRLGDEQCVWLQQRMDECRKAGRQVILLHHHPILSSGPKYPVAEPDDTPDVNNFLWKQLLPYMDMIALAAWGHEHSQRIYEPFTKDGATLQRGRLLGHGSKWKPAKNDRIPFIKTPHPQARGIGLTVLEFSMTQCIARYLELGNGGELLEHYREEL